MNYIINLINNSLSSFTKNESLQKLDKKLALLKEGENTLQITLSCFCVFEDEKKCFTIETGNSSSPSGLSDSKYDFVSFVFSNGDVKTMFKNDFFEKIKPYVKQKEEAFFYMNKEFNAMAIRAKAECINKVIS